MDALRDSVYTCLYKNENGNLTPLIDYSALDLDELVSLLKEKGEKILFTGDGIIKHKDLTFKNIYLTLYLLLII